MVENDSFSLTLVSSVNCLSIWQYEGTGNTTMKLGCYDDDGDQSSFTCFGA